MSEQATAVPFDKYGNRDFTNVPLESLTGPPSKLLDVRLAQIRATLAGKLVCVGPYSAERYEIVPPRADPTGETNGT